MSCAISAFKAFMDVRRMPKDDYRDCTNSSLQGGRFYVEGQDRPEFHTLMARALDSGLETHFVEMHRHIGPVLINLNFYQMTPVRLYTVAHIDAFVRVLGSTLRAMFPVADATLFDCHVLEKGAHPRDCGKSFMKDGVHFHMPRFATQPSV